MGDHGILKFVSMTEIYEKTGTNAMFAPVCKDRNLRNNYGVAAGFGDAVIGAELVTSSISVS